MKIKIFVQPFVLPYLEATNFAQDYNIIQPSSHTDYIINRFQSLLPSNRIKPLYDTWMDRLNRRNENNFNYTQPITIEIDPNFLPPEKMELIRSTFIVSYDFSHRIKTEIYTHFITMMQQQYIIEKQSISEVITNFYRVFLLDEDTIPSQNLRKYWQVKKPYKKGNRDIFRNQLLSKKHLSDVPSPSN